MFPRNGFFHLTTFRFFRLMAVALPALTFPAASFGLETTAYEAPFMVAQADLASLDLEFWNSVKDATDADSYRAYLETFPQGHFASLARVRIKRIESATRAAPVAARRPTHRPTPAPPPAVAPPPRQQSTAPRPTRGGRTSSQSDDISTALRRARNAVRANRLTSPANDNAVMWGERVLRKHPTNTQALDILSEVVGTYVTWARSNLKRKRYERAQSYLNRAQRLRQYATRYQLTEIARMRKTLAELQAPEPEAQPARPPVAAPAIAVAPTPVAIPTRPQLSAPALTPPVIPRVQGNIPTVITIEVWVEPTTRMRFARIPRGCFVMGSAESERGRLPEETQHQVCVEPFWMATHEVTNAQYHLFDPDHDSGDFQGYALNGDRQPVVKINWANAADYAKWLSEKTGQKFRLPTEAEWEFAARAGSQTARFWGDDPKQACGHANVQDEQAFAAFQWGYHHHCADGHAVTAPIGQYPPNAFGLHDMLGNAWEWTCTQWNANYGGDENRCVEKKWAPSFRVIRGGSWTNPPRNVRSAFRMNRPPTSSTHDYGFRLIREHD